MGRFVHDAGFNAGGYFRTDCQASLCGSFSLAVSSSMLNLLIYFGLGNGQDIEGFGRGDARVPAPSRAWRVEGFLECSLM